MSALPFDSTHTWPRSLQPLKVPSRNDATSRRSQAQKAIAEAEKFVEKASDDLFSQEAKNVIRVLGNCLEQYQTREQAEDPVEFLRVANDEPRFESMICVNPDAWDRIPMTAMNCVSAGPGSCADVSVFEAKKDPAFVLIVPHLVMFAILVAYLVGGTFIFQLLDPALSSQPFNLVMLWAFQGCSSIGKA
ncbi:hypothetical protein AAVH_26350 [Aphelenchoides avenae]|nr:hypothetical protein AAVH_26350 [Aphelenchus avenae]